MFVVGNSRSGTTMMARMLGQSSTVHYLPETHFFGELWDPHSDTSEFSQGYALEIVAKLLARVRDGYYQQDSYRSYLAEASEILADAPYVSWNIFSRFLAYEAQRSGKTIACEQTPRNVSYLEPILGNYTGARVICMIRDPRDVLLSQKRRWRRRWLGASNIPLFETIRAWANYHPVTTSKIWNATTESILMHRGHMRCRVVRYEDLICNPEAVLFDVMTWLGLQYESQQLQIPQVGSSSSKNVTSGTGVRTDRVAAWRGDRTSNTDLRICENICGGKMREFDYEPSAVKSMPLMHAYKYLSLPFQLILAFAMNLRRRFDLIQSLGRRIRLPNLTRLGS
ncbi:MAG: sulfotransferase [Gammaproteobacteria bacterium]|nr:sulfotransferase [Gammaproteobacteria bacterium]